MASGWDLNYDQFRQAMDAVAGEGANSWSSPNSGALALQLAGGKTWHPSGASSGVSYTPATPSGAYQWDENSGVPYALPPGHWEADHGWHLDNPPPPTYDPETGNPVNNSVMYFNTQPFYQEGTPEHWTIGGDLSALLGQEGSNQHTSIDYVKQGDKLVPMNAPTNWTYSSDSFLPIAAQFALTFAAPGLASELAGALGVSNATAGAILNAGVNVAAGQDPLKAIENAAISYGVGAAGGAVASKLASEGLDKALAGNLGGMAGNVAGTIAKGGDPLAALISGGIGMGTSALADQIPGFSDLPAAAQKAITTTMASELQGKDPTQALMSQALNAGMTAAKGYSSNLPDSFYDPATGTSPVNAADIGTGGGTTSPTWNPADFPVQDFGAGATDQYNAEYQKNLQDLAASGGYTPQWVPNADSTHTLTNDDGSTITVDATGNVTGVTNATDTKFAGTPATKPATGAATTAQATAATQPVSGTQAPQQYAQTISSAPTQLADIGQQYDISGTDIFNTQASPTKSTSAKPEDPLKYLHGYSDGGSIDELMKYLKG